MKSILELSETIDNMGKKVIKNAMSAQRSVARKITEEIKQDVNETVQITATGEYANSIKQSETYAKDDKIITEIYSDLMVTSKRGQSYNLGMLLETGTSPHIIFSKEGKMLRFEIDGKVYYRPLVRHPGTKPYNYFGRALNNNKTYYQEEIRKAVKEGMK